MLIDTVNPASNDKVYLRDYFKEKRARLCDDLSRKDALDAEIQARLIISAEYRSASTMLVYMARPFEISSSMIIFAALANNKAVGLPVSLDGGKMIFKRIKSLSQLVPGRYGILEPGAECEELQTDDTSLCVCPSLCCDMQGRRLGFGAGYYDRYLADFKGVKAALCYSDSVIPSIDGDKYDIPMDMICTDSYTRYIR